ncbi:bifunctional phosphoribosyl-AMP cyclohydrolase/phosphoribosyl-ATP diphosphatase HisIE [Candidatus Tachikawaea gelatinosa]|uniref:Histidine biosynthesis bifunctional protein HisIE n=1 Tax=Candidatus Tachikawaea gelatinosa TaxID=1410383 RepID=A0A090BWJ2_9ENTR|nr:bifunctional phosphoribosyl-AMP cyclohydrolase/phosphoribosyl-ATP diphosphatase HisIE [Candidatus Tachikawaea gelatinosa]BAP58701.1 bifunctional phosphoribosyl-AMP cyclohydrolase/phosphoribosyl-ATP pyrophosphatase protein [Candidatus Tachikawaea gelatinosa]
MLNTQEINSLDWIKTNGLIPAIIQDKISGQILMHGYMNKIAVKNTVTTKKVTFFSRTKKSIWIKGEKSGNFLYVVDVLLDCDKDTLLILVNPVKYSCHLDEISCFSSKKNKTFLYDLEELISLKKNDSLISSYTTELYSQGTKRIAQKVAEEGIETALAAVVNDNNELINEASDLIYHLLVLLQEKNINFNMIIKNLFKRYKKNKINY